LATLQQQQQPPPPLSQSRYIAVFFAGADVNAADYDKRTPLHIAAAEAKLSMVQLLVAEGGAELSAADRWGNTPLAEATRVGAPDVVRYLRSSDAQAAAVKARQAAADRLQVSRRYGMRASSGGCSPGVAGVGGVTSSSVSSPTAAAAAAGGGMTPLQRSLAAEGATGGSMERAQSKGDAAIDEAVKYFDAHDD
jgi:hypothetical protein